MLFSWGGMGIEGIGSVAIAATVGEITRLDDGDVFCLFMHGFFFCVPLTE
jgi:hypothetical protein